MTDLEFDYFYLVKQQQKVIEESVTSLPADVTSLPPLFFPPHFIFFSYQKKKKHGLHIVFDLSVK